jgi:peptidyl-prolyl cis-trans isomerase NIMA-interacting 1
MVESMDAQDSQAIADIAAAALQATQQGAVGVTTKVPPVPRQLPQGWVLKESHSQPGYYYYYDHFTGVSSWQPPPEDENESNVGSSEPTPAPAAVLPLPEATKKEEERFEQAPLENASITAVGSKKRTFDQVNDQEESEREPSINKLPRKEDKIRVLHILKKHKDSRRPTSWRNSKITVSRDEAEAELRGLMELLEEVKADPAELRATMEELARTESDCSSAKRGGDLGYFEYKKMQPPFSAAAYNLEVGQLSDVVDTNSGVHVLLRIG